VDAVLVVEGEVRELVRRRGLDPQADPVQVRDLVEAVVADYGERSLTGGLPALADPQGAVRDVLDSVAGLGPLQRYLDDPTVEEIWVNEPGRVFVARAGRSELTTTILNDGQVRDLVEKMLKTTGRRVDLSTPFVDAMLPDGSRLHVVIPDIVRRHWSVNIRKFVVAAGSLDELIGLRTITTQAARFLEASIAAGLNVIVAGRLDPRPGAGRHLRRGLRTASAAARRRCDADPPAQPRGHRRDPAAAARQGIAAHAARPDHRR